MKTHLTMAMLALLLVLTVGVVFATPIPATNEIIPQGSQTYSNLRQQQREWSALSSSSKAKSNNTNSSSLTIDRTRVIFGGQNCSSPYSCNDTARDKQIRLQSIQDYVLSTIGRGKAPTTSSRGPMQSQNPQTTPFSGEIKTFFASCEVPSRVDETVWTDPDYFHVHFKFTPTHLKPTQQNNNTTILNGTTAINNGSQAQTTLFPKKPFTIISAKLRMFKLGFDGSSYSEKNETASLLNQLSGQSGTTMRPLMSGSGTEIMPLVEEKIRVSVYWYKAPVTKTHYKKKLLDTKMVSVKESKWIEFDIINAAVVWLDRPEKNFGLVVEVENEDNDPLDPSDYFANLACPGNNSSSNTSSTPITFTLPLNPPPQLEICILNTPYTQRDVETTSSPTVPYPLQMNQGFNILSRMAKAHEQQRAANSNNTNNANTTNPFSFSGTEWQNDDLPPTIFPASNKPSSRQTHSHHKHRHGHGMSKPVGANKKQSRITTTGSDSSSASTNSGFQLDEDHPLRRILANVHSNRRHQQNHHGNDNLMLGASSSSSASEDSFEGDRDIIIQKIYIRGDNTGGSSSSNTQQDR